MSQNKCYFPGCGSDVVSRRCDYFEECGSMGCKDHLIFTNSEGHPSLWKWPSETFRCPETCIVCYYTKIYQPPTPELEGNSTSTV